MMYNSVCKVLSIAPPPAYTMLAMLLSLQNGSEGWRGRACGFRILTCAAWLWKMFLEHTSACGELIGEGTKETQIVYMLF